MSHASHKGRRKFTEETALKTVSKCAGLSISADPKAIILSKKSRPGNGTWGAIDYLHHKHGYLPVRELRSGKLAFCG